MKLFVTMTLRCLIILSFLILNAGCSAKNKETASSDNGTEGTLRYIGKGVCLDMRTGRMWQVDREGKFYSFQEAQQYAANLELGGHNDWRLPTEQEFFDLYYAFFWHKNGNCDLKYEGDYWGTGEDGNPTVGRWESYFVCGPEFRYIKSLKKKGYVRAVRQ